MRTRVVLFVSLLVLTSSFRPEETGALKVILSNIKKTGKIHVAVYRESEEFPDDKTTVKRLTMDASSGGSQCQFEGIPFGSYAVAVYQDINGNGKLDKGMFGIPDEPFAFSNNFRPRFGGPSFEKCKFDFKENNQEVNIEMINSLFGGG